MPDTYKKYRLTSMEEPTDEMLQALMEDVVKEGESLEDLFMEMITDGAE